MHEHGIADRIVETALRHPDRPQGTHPIAITVLVSELGGLRRDALQASIDHVCEHEGLPHIDLEVKTVPLLGCCADCGHISELTEDLACPVCRIGRVRLCGGETVVVESCRYG